MANLCTKLVALSLALAGQQTAAETVSPPAVDDSAVMLCAERSNWGDGGPSAAGWQNGSTYSLVARGQRLHEFSNEERKTHLSLHSSFGQYVACSTSVDVPSPNDYAPTRDALTEKLAARRGKMSDVRLSKEAEAFVREKDLSNVADTFINDGFVFLFGQRQYEGRNIVWIYAIVREKGNQ